MQNYTIYISDNFDFKNNFNSRMDLNSDYFMPDSQKYSDFGSKPYKAINPYLTYPKTRSMPKEIGSKRTHFFRNK